MTPKDSREAREQARRTAPEQVVDPVLAYRDQEFLDSDEARPVRILAEYIQPLQAFEQHKVRDTIVFFGSARLLENGPLGRYYAEARELARRITEWSQRLESAARPFVVCSGVGGGANVVASPPSPWMRLAISSAQVSVTSVQIEAVLR